MLRFLKDFQLRKFNQLEQQLQGANPQQQLKIWSRLLRVGVESGVFILDVGRGGGVNSETYFPFDTRTAQFWYITGFNDHTPLASTGYVVTAVSLVADVPSKELSRFGFEMINPQDFKHPGLVELLKTQILNRIQKVA